MNRIPAVLLSGLAGAALAAVPPLDPRKMPKLGGAGFVLPPQTQPTTRPIASVLPGPFSVLLHRSIFARDGVAAPIPGMPGGPGEMGGPEAGLALRGVVRDDSQFLAFVEDTASHRTIQLRSGDSVGAGRIKDITLETVAYESGGKLMRIQVGHNFLGMPLPPMPPPSPPQPAPGQVGPNGPQAPGGPPPGQGTPEGAMPAMASPAQTQTFKVRQGPPK